MIRRRNPEVISRRLPAPEAGQLRQPLKLTGRAPKRARFQETLT